MERHRARIARIGIVGVLVLAAFLVGRITSPPPHTAPDTAAVREATALLASLDGLEAEITSARAGTDHNTELARRHDHVTAIACENAVAHLKSSEELARRSLRRRREPRPEPEPTVSAPDDPAGGAGHRRTQGPHGPPPPARHDDAISP